MKITCHADDLGRALRACKFAMSDDGIRPHLSCIWLRGLAGNRAHVFATNRHWLAVHRLDGADVTETGLAQIPFDQLPKVLLAVPRRTPRPFKVDVAGTPTTVSLTTPSGRIELKVPDVQPPPLVDVVPAGKSPKKHSRVSLSTVLLSQALQAIDASSSGRKGGACARIIPTGPSDCDPQIIWSPMAGQFFALLMPMRDGRKRDMSWWTDHASAITAEIEAAKASAAAAE